MQTTQPTKPDESGKTKMANNSMGGGTMFDTELVARSSSIRVMVRLRVRIPFYSLNDLSLPEFEDCTQPRLQPICDGHTSEH